MINSLEYFIPASSDQEDDEFILEFIITITRSNEFIFFDSSMADECKPLIQKIEEESLSAFQEVAFAWQDYSEYRVIQTSDQIENSYYHFLPIEISKAFLVWRSCKKEELLLDKSNYLKKILSFFYRSKINLDKSLSEMNEINKRFQETQALVKVIDRLAMISVTDRKGTIQQVNHLFCNVSGYNAEELIGSDHRLLNSGTHSKQFFTDLWSTIIRGDVWRGEICNRTKDGNKYWVDASICGYFNSEKEIVNFISIRTDITDKKKNEIQLQEQQMAIVSSSRMSSLGEMASGIAHEINNPLAIISGYIGLMEYDINNPDKIQESMRKISNTIIRIEKIIKGLRSFAREGASDPFEEISVNTFIVEALDLCTLRTGGMNLLIHFKELVRDVSVSGRLTQLIQVLVNLVNNSLDEIINHEKPWIKIEVIESDEWVDICVQDSGKGVPAAVQEKMMQPFFTTKSVGKGTGLGLSISYGIMKQHGGSLIYELKDEHTCFVMRLPKIKSSALK